MVAQASLWVMPLKVISPRYEFTRKTSKDGNREGALAFASALKSLSRLRVEARLSRVKCLYGTQQHDGEKKKFPEIRGCLRAHHAGRHVVRNWPETQQVSFARGRQSKHGRNARLNREWLPWRLPARQYAVLMNIVSRTCRGSSSRDNVQGQCSFINSSSRRDGTRLCGLLRSGGAFGRAIHARRPRTDDTPWPPVSSGRCGQPADIRDGHVASGPVFFLPSTPSLLSHFLRVRIPRALGANALLLPGAALSCLKRSEQEIPSDEQSRHQGGCMSERSTPLERCPGGCGDAHFVL